MKRSRIRYCSNNPVANGASPSATSLKHICRKKKETSGCSGGISLCEASQEEFGDLFKRRRSAFSQKKRAFNLSKFHLFLKKNKKTKSSKSQTTADSKTRPRFWESYCSEFGAWYVMLVGLLKLSGYNSNCTSGSDTMRIRSFCV